MFSRRYIYVAITVASSWSTCTKAQIDFSQLGLPEECGNAVSSLNENVEVMAAKSMFINDLINACYDSANMACDYDIDLMSGVEVILNACDMQQLDDFQTKCERNGYQFCSMSATVESAVQLEDLADLPFASPVPVAVQAHCFGLCIPFECGPDILETLSPFEFTLDFLDEMVEEAVEDGTGFEIELDDPLFTMAFDCLEPSTNATSTNTTRGIPWID